MEKTEEVILDTVRNRGKVIDVIIQMLEKTSLEIYNSIENNITFDEQFEKILQNLNDIELNINAMEEKLINTEPDKNYKSCKYLESNSCGNYDDLNKFCVYLVEKAHKVLFYLNLNILRILLEKSDN